MPDFGGIRIEQNVLVTEDGWMETTEDIPLVAMSPRRGTAAFGVG